MALLRLITLLCIALGLVGCLTLDNAVNGDETPGVIDKEFAVVAAPNGVTLDGKMYPYGTALEVIAHDGEQFSVVGWGWDTVSLPKARLDSGEFGYGKVAWDRANNRLSFLDPPETSWLVRYFHWTQTFLSRAWPFALTFVALTVCLLVAAFGAGYSDEGCEISLSMLGTIFLLLFIGSCQGNNYYGLYDWGSSQAKLATASGHIYPVSSGALNATHTISYDLGLILWVPAFVFLHLVVMALVPLFVRGVAQSYYRTFVLKKGILMSEDKKRIEGLSMVPVDAVVSTASWKSRLLRIFGISENEEHDRQVRLYQSATEVLKAEIEYHKTRGVRDRLPVSVAIDTLQELSRFIEESMKFRQLSAERDAKEERARRRKETAAERVVRQATEKSALQLEQQLSGFLIDTQKAELIAEVISILRHDAGEDEKAQERVRRIEEAIRRVGDGRS